MTKLEEKIQEINRSNQSDLVIENQLATLCRDYAEKFGEWMKDVKESNGVYLTDGKYLLKQDLIAEFEKQHQTI